MSSNIIAAKLAIISTSTAIVKGDWNKAPQVQCSSAVAIPILEKKAMFLPRMQLRIRRTVVGRRRVVNDCPDFQGNDR